MLKVMKQEQRTEARERLARLIRRVLADGQIDERERDEMQEFFKDALMGVSDVREVYIECSRELRDQVLSDGVVTREEADRCKRVVEQLRIPLRFLPPDMVDIVTGVRLPDADT
jgi:hypothetical protein